MQYNSMGPSDAVRIGLSADDFIWAMDREAHLAAMGLIVALELEPGGAEQAEVAVPTALVTLDAVEESDLAAIANTVVASATPDGVWLPCGLVGLASSWTRRLLGESRDSAPLINRPLTSRTRC